MRIACIGDNNVDIYPDQRQVFPGGNCLNVAAYSAQNGCGSLYLGNVGDDDWGHIQMKALERERVDTHAIRVYNEKTSSAMVKLTGNERSFWNYDNTIHVNYPLSLAKKELEEMRGYDVIHTSRYSIFADGMLKKLYNQSVPISYDFSNDWDDKELESVCPLVSFAFFSCDNRTENNIWQLLKSSVNQGVKVAIATKGRDGAYAFDGEKEYRQAAYKVSPVDTLGAGDSFISMFLKVYFELLIPSKAYLSEIAEKSGGITGINRHFQKIIEISLSQASLYAAKNCMKTGAFCSPALY